MRSPLPAIFVLLKPGAPLQCTPVANRHLTARTFLIRGLVGVGVAVLLDAGRYVTSLASCEHPSSLYIFFVLTSEMWEVLVFFSLFRHVASPPAMSRTGIDSIDETRLIG